LEVFILMQENSSNVPAHMANSKNTYLLFRIFSLCYFFYS
jgi:hypothetical protein